MEVIKRNGSAQPVRFDKITARVKKLAYGLDPIVDVIEVAQKVCAGVHNGVRTSELDELAAETAAYMSTRHSDYSLLASRIAVSNLHKNTIKSFSETMQRLYDHVDPKSGEPLRLVSSEFIEAVRDHKDIIDASIIYDRDFSYNYFAFKTLERSYLLRADGQVLERPQHMLMRVSIGIHGRNIESVLETYEHLSLKNFTHASPTLFNAGTPLRQLSSCFLLTTVDDSIEGIFDTLKRCAVISKGAGGIGLSIHNVRATGSLIRSTNGTSNGLVPMLRVFNDTARYVDQGGGKRKGAFAIYLEPWHADVLDFLNLRKNHGKEENRARDLFYALWVPDLFMERVQRDQNWSLFCPNEAKGLADVWGSEFETLYTSYEARGYARNVIPARKLWFAILEAQMETGTPYMMYKDSCNRKSNQNNIGTIQSSNLCTEVVQYTSEKEVAVCNLASISLPRMVSESVEGPAYFDHNRLREITKVVTKNLNQVIDVNEYPLPEAERSNKLHRPIGIGVQGLADVFIMLRMPFESDEARVLNRDIFETIYFAALEASCELAVRDGTYWSYKGSPVSQGVLQMDMWGVTPSCRWNWTELRERIATHGLRNSLLVAPMPTATTSQILGNNECFEPYTSNIYTRRVLAGEFTVVNQHLVKDLQKLGLWDSQVKNQIITDNGSIQNIVDVPESIKQLYKTVWEISQKRLLDMAADRGAFIDQSQSLNVHIAAPNIAKLSSMHFHGWKLGLKTGMYYLRTKPAADAIKFTIDPNDTRSATTTTSGAACSILNGPDCTSCGS